MINISDFPIFVLSGLFVVSYIVSLFIFRKIDDVMLKATDYIWYSGAILSAILFLLNARFEETSAAASKIFTEYRESMSELLSDHKSIYIRCVTILKSNECFELNKIYFFIQTPDTFLAQDVFRGEKTDMVDKAIFEVLSTFDIKTEEQDSGIEERSIWIDYELGSEGFLEQFLKDDIYWHTENIRRVMVDQSQELLQAQSLEAENKSQRFYSSLWPFLLTALAGIRFAKISQEIRSLKRKNIT